MKTKHKAKVLNFEASASGCNHLALDFDDPKQDRVAAYFHTGGTTGTPKVAAAQAIPA